MDYITSDMVIKVDEGFKELIPALQEEEYATLFDSIRESGIETPVVLWRSNVPEFHNIIIDGMHRYKAGTELGIPIPYVYKDFESVPDVKIWMIRNQLGRRNLTTAQKADLAVESKHAYEDAAKERMLRGVSATETEQTGKSAALAAKDVGVSVSTVESMEAIHKVRDVSPELHKMVKDNIISVATGSDLARLPAPVREELIRKVDTTASTRDNTRLLKPLIQDIRAKQSTEEAIVKVETRAKEEEQTLVDRFSAFFDKHIANPRRDPLSYVDKVEYFGEIAERKARLLTLPAPVMDRLLKYLELKLKVDEMHRTGRYVDRSTRDTLTAVGLMPTMGRVEFSLSHVETLLANGVPITETTNIKAEAERIIAAKSAAELERKTESAINREANREVREAEEAEVESRRQGRETNARVISAFNNAAMTFVGVLREGKVFCPVHGPDCKFDMSKLAFECGTDLLTATTLSADNMRTLAPKTEQVPTMIDVEIRTVDGRLVKDKRPSTKTVRVAGDVGKLYIEQP